MLFTSKYNLKKPDGSDSVSIHDINGNMDIIDEALTPVFDQAQAPTTANTGKLALVLGWFANRLKAITGKTNWYEAPSKTMEQLNTDKVDKVTVATKDGAVVRFKGTNGAIQESGVIIDNSDNLSVKTLKSTAAVGTQPIQVTSPTMCENLNAEMLGGKKIDDFETYIFMDI